MTIYEKYEEMGLMDYKLRTVTDVKALHGTDILAMKGLDKLTEEDKKLVVKLFIGYLNGCGCGNRQDVPVSVSKLNENKFKVCFDDGTYSYLYSDGSIG